MIPQRFAPGDLPILDSCILQHTLAQRTSASTCCHNTSKPSQAIRRSCYTLRRSCKGSKHVKTKSCHPEDQNHCLSAEPTTRNSVAFKRSRAPEAVLASERRTQTVPDVSYTWFVSTSTLHMPPANKHASGAECSIITNAKYTNLRRDQRSSCGLANPFGSLSLSL